jgi:8-amino-7-oxononanoate synthase
MYAKELKAIKKANRLRDRQLFAEDIIDMASNDYLGLSTRKKSLKKAYDLVKKYRYISPKASMLVNGYHPLHKKFEKTISKLNGFEDAIVVGSGFLANLSLIESLVRKNDILFMDEEYHASGVMASKLLGDRAVVFRHNDMQHLKDLLQTHRYKRAIIAVEGIYSMGGDLCHREIFDIAKEYPNVLLIVDEAHSAGVVGKHLLGVYDYYDIKIEPNHIKMGTLGKAYGSYGAYILASKEIILFLQNRAKPIIYSTAPSVFDIALALVNLNYIIKNTKKISNKIFKIQQKIYLALDIKCDSLIVAIKIGDNKKVLEIQQELLKSNILVGAIREPTVPAAIIRFIPNISIKSKDLKYSLELIANYGKILKN